MKIKATVLVPVFVLILIAVFLLDFLRLQRSPEHIPDLHFTSITGKVFSLSSLRGKPVLVTFWASDCPSCIKDMPHLIALYQQYHAQGLEIIAIAMQYDPPNHVLEMTRAKALPYDVVLDLKGDYAHAFADVAVTPNSFLLAPDGSIVLHQLGLLNNEKMQALLTAMLKKG